MRRVLLAAVVFGLLWTGYWLAGAWAIKWGIGQGLAGFSGAARSASAERVSVHGIPNAFDLTVTRIAVADKAAGWAWAAPAVAATAMAWAPWHVVATIGPEQTITLPQRSFALLSDPVLAELRLHPNLSLGLNSLTVAVSAARLTEAGGWALGLEKAVVSVAENPGGGGRYRLGLNVTGLAPDAAFLAQIAAIGLPDRVDALYLDASIALTAPLDRHAGVTAPRLTALDVADLHLDWGDFRLSAKGRLAIGADGYLQGEIPVTVVGWQKLPPLLVATGTLPPEREQLVFSALRALAQQNADLDNVVLTLKYAEGWSYLGPFPLGPAPKLH